MKFKMVEFIGHPIMCRFQESGGNGTTVKICKPIKVLPDDILATEDQILIESISNYTYKWTYSEERETYLKDNGIEYIHERPSCNCGRTGSLNVKAFVEIIDDAGNEQQDDPQNGNEIGD